MIVFVKNVSRLRDTGAHKLDVSDVFEPGMMDVSVWFIGVVFQDVSKVLNRHWPIYIFFSIFFIFFFFITEIIFKIVSYFFTVKQFKKKIC